MRFPFKFTLSRGRGTRPVLPRVLFEPLESRQLLSAASPALPGVDVLTYHDNNARTGLNDAEATLTPSTVNAGSFGKLYASPVDGQVYAQPLVVSGLNVKGTTRNVVYVATEHDSVYAFDADTGATLWRREFTDASRGITTVPYQDVGTDDIAREIGITGTPVIDRANGAIYFVTKTKRQGGGVSYHQELHALDLASGADKFGGPVEITATVPGQGVGTTGIEDPMISFDPLRQLNRGGAVAGQRPGLHRLGLARRQPAVPRLDDELRRQNPQADGGVQHHARGAARGDLAGRRRRPSSDGKNLYVAVGNGTFDASTGGDDYGTSIVKLSPDLKVTDHFTPANQFERIQQDADTGSTGAVLIPSPRGGKLLVSGTKAGDLIVNDPNDLGGFHLSGDRNVQTVDHATPKQNYSTASYFNGSIYIAGNGDQVKQYKLGSDGKLQTHYANQSPERYGFPGATTSISANGTSDGIVWAIDRQAFTDASHTGDATPHAVLKAYDATTMSELYSSDAKASDDAGVGIKFSVPTVANGKVFVGTANGLSVFGETQIAPPPPPTSTASAVKRLALVNADTGQLVKGYLDLNNGDRVNLSALGIKNVSLVAYAAAGPHGPTDGTFSSPVTFDLDGSYTHVERHAPHSLFGDYNNGNSYYGRALAAGTHTVSATVDGAAYSVSFTVV